MRGFDPRVSMGASKCPSEEFLTRGGKSPYTCVVAFGQFNDTKKISISPFTDLPEERALLCLHFQMKSMSG